jgi:hypothetical protein
MIGTITQCRTAKMRPRPVTDSRPGGTFRTKKIIVSRRIENRKKIAVHVRHHDPAYQQE